MAMPKPGNITEQGMSFLKNAFAPPDFIQSDLMGVPDFYQNVSLVKKHKFVSSLAIEVYDYYYLLLPIPGIAYAYLRTAPGEPPTETSQFTLVPYSDFTSMFGASPKQSADLVTKFRFVSNHIEVIPTINAMSWSGSIQAWKIPLALSIRPALSDNPTSIYSITGLNSLLASNANQYTAPFIMGFYGSCFNANSDFEFSSIIEGTTEIPAVIIPGEDFGQLHSGDVGHPTGLDNNFESLVVKISGIATDMNMSAIMKTWATVEYQPNPGNMIYEFASFSPPKDEVALELYRRCIQDLPIGVSYVDNDGFWKRVLGVIQTVTGLTANIPGTVGGVSRGINILANTISPFLK